MKEVEKRASVEILEMLIDHELSLGYENADAEFISECVDLSLAIQEIKIDPQKTEEGLKKILQVMEDKRKEAESGSNENNQNT